MKPNGWGLYGTLALLFASSGCFVSKSQLTTVETQNRVLNEQLRAQTVEIENLKAHSRQTEDQLIHAEQDLASGRTAGEGSRSTLESGRRNDRPPSAIY